MADYTDQLNGISNSLSSLSGGIGGLGNMMKQQQSKATWGAVGGLLGNIGSLLGTKDNTINGTDEMTSGMRSSAETAMLSSGNPFVMAAGAGLMAIDKTGGFTDASQGLGGGADLGNAIASMALPGAGYFIKSLDKVNKSEELELSSSYGGTSDNIDKANVNAGKILFGRNKAKDALNEAKRQEALATNILQEQKENSMALNGSIDMMNLQAKNQYNSSNGLYNGSLFAAKNGARLQHIKDMHQIDKYEEEIFNEFDKERRGFLNVFFDFDDFTEENFNKTIEDNMIDYYNSIGCEVEEISDEYDYDNKEENKELNSVPEFRDGGTLNVIPEGSLHKNKHNIDLGEDVNITKKGIPVVSEEDGKITLHAEIEENEIIFAKEATDAIKELRSQYEFSKTQEEKDSIAIEAGKMIVDEILNYTDDRTGLIKKVS